MLHFPISDSKNVRFSELSIKRFSYENCRIEGLTEDVEVWGSVDVVCSEPVARKVDSC